MPADLTVREYDAPHHLSQDHPLTEVGVLRDGAGELVVIDGFSRLGLSEFHQLPRRGPVQAEVAAQSRFDVGTLGRTELVIGVRKLEEERSGSELDSTWPRLALWGLGARLHTHDPARDETLDRV